MRSLIQRKSEIREARKIACRARALAHNGKLREAGKHQVDIDSRTPVIATTRGWLRQGAPNQ